MTSKQFTCGDILVFTKTNGPLIPIQHYAVYVGNNEIVHYNPVQGANQHAKKSGVQSKIRQENIYEYLKRFAADLNNVHRLQVLLVSTIMQYNIILDVIKILR